MLSREALKDILHVKGLTRTDQVLLCLAAEGSPLAVAGIKALATSAGLRRVKDWNVSTILQRAKGLAVRTNSGWELNGAGRNATAKLIAAHSPGPVTAPANSLRALLPRVSSATSREFLLEAVTCAEYGQLRAAIVFAWVGAVAVLHQHVVASHLQSFNAEASRRDSKWKAVTSVGGLTRMKEFDFLQILESIGVVGKNTKSELEACLKLRNACGHPSSLSVAEHRVASHIEVLLLNVYVPFAT